jgi:DHA1 family bicyclomycin/chloramphenicol resistance-like MFS transporter
VGTDPSRGARRLRYPAPDSAVTTGLVGALLAITPLSLDIALPALPGVALAFGGDPARAHLVVATFLLGLALGQLAYGPVSDRVGRRPVLLVALALYVGAGVVCALATSLAWLVSGRLLQGLGACAGPVIARAVVRDVHEPVRGAQVLSFAAMAMSLAPIVSAITGGLLMMALPWRSVFVVLVGFGVALAVAVAVALPETNLAWRGTALSFADLAHNYALVATDRTFIGFALTLAAGSVGLFAWISGSPFVLMTWIGLPPHLYGAAFATVNLGQLGGAALSTRLAVRVGIERTIAVGLVFYVTGGIALAALLAGDVRHPAAVIVPMAAFQFGNGLVMPNTLVGAIAPFRRMAGSASALAGFVQMVAGASSGVVLGRLHDGSARPMGLLVLGAALAAVAAFRLLVWGRRSPA